jgi:hypothetical protein
MKKTKKYIAFYGRNTRILSIIADSEDEARRRIREQLNRPGRRQYLKRWQNSGEQIKTEAF